MRRTYADDFPEVDEGGHEGTQELTGLRVDEVSLVDRPANLRPFLVIKSAGGNGEMGDVMTLTDAQISEIESDLSTKAPGEEGLVSKAARAKGGVLDALTEAKLRGAKRMLASLDPEDRKLVLGRGDDDGADDDAAKCRKCRTTLKEGAAFCHKCGTSRKEARKADAEPGADGPAPGASRCAKCGAHVSMSEAFCTKCGAGAGGSGSDFARHLEKALDSAQAVKPLVTRASRLNPDTLRELQSALQQLAVNITGGHDPIEVGGENIGVNPLEGVSARSSTMPRISIPMSWRRCLNSSRNCALPG